MSNSLSNNINNSPVSLREIYQVIESVRSEINDRERLLSAHRPAAVAAALAAGAIIEREQQYFLAPAVQPVENVKVQPAIELMAQIPLIAGSDPALSEHARMINECTHSNEIWLDDGERESEPVELLESKWPVFAGLKLKNGNRAIRDQYLCYLGSKAAVLTANEELADLGIVAEITSIGKSGNYQLTITLNPEGELQLAEVA